jgi:hypothetical protein
MTGPSHVPKASGPDPLDDEHRYRADAANYIAEMTASLAKMARNHNLEALGYILDMARLEAENAIRHARGQT